MMTFFLGENRERGTYKPCFSNGRRTAFIPHIVSSDGSVTPSVVCRPPCDFHEFIRLDKWS